MSSGRINPERRPAAPAPAAAPAAAQPVTGAAPAASPASPAPAAAEPQTAFTTARPPAGGAPAQDAASAAVNAREARRGAKYAEYDRLLKDGKLDIAIGVGYDETGADKWAWSQIQRSLVNQGFRLDKVNSEGVHIYKQRVNIEGRDIDITVNAFDGRGTKDPLKKFTEAMSNNELVIYTGHARYGSGPDFDDKHDNTGNYFIGRGYTAPTKPDNLYEGASASGLKATDATKEYQMMLMFGCKTKDYESQIRNLLKGTRDLDLVTTQDIAYWNDLPKGVDLFLKGLKAGKPQDEIIGEMNREIKGENPDKDLFAWKGGQDNKYQPGQAIPTTKSVDDVLAGRASVTIERDANGKLVYDPVAERAQKLLIKAGIPLGNSGHRDTDGYFGPISEGAVKAFQQREGLPTTGVIDGATMRKLESYSEFSPDR